MSYFLNNVGSHAKSQLLLSTNEIKKKKKKKKKRKMSVRTFLPRALQLRRLPRVLRPRATWAQVWREILNPREVHAKKKNKDGFPFP